MEKSVYIIGSGPAAVSAATALLARDIPVTMLDVGIELESEKKSLLEQVKTEWDAHTYAQLKHSISKNRHQKLSYGSNYPYQHPKNRIDILQSKNISCTPSFARGGLSNVWGGYAAQYNEEDLQQWPISKNQLSPYYQLVSKIIYLNRDHQCSSQANVLLESMLKNQTLLRNAGVSFEKARLAALFHDVEKKNSCLYCGNCQHGCPKDLIYSAQHTLKKLLNNRKFLYFNNIYVEKIINQEECVLILATNLKNKNQPVTFKAQRVFLAAGAISSTKILLHSMKKFNSAVILKDSGHIIVPCLMNESIQNIKNEKLHTLTQLTLRIKNNEVSKKAVHAQIYTYMDHYTAQFKKIFNISYPLFKPLVNKIINRMLVLQCYFHSNESPSCHVSLLPNGKTLLINNHDKYNAAYSQEIKNLITFLKTYKENLHFSPVSFLTKRSKILGANHYGGTFPMCNIRNSWQTTDLLGRPLGMDRVHVIDASIFPTIPAQSITLTIMANAYRIASEVKYE
ncbi:MAG: hypothetical protein A3C44_03345 [Gammaproteobacteria bacterium RIFCSPHIGHO2_02_FULL_39_13]|nr:MAG: hypothetical protein A3C44_03345 [Gammaproteobacteria bacterium RIFCSPHIGHO2_02_FULL_39_13]OGT48565.1 MAG: hypothetical protein A3E53_04235 [Gammaproteobacteria bacterium RIFCSPHIGHO2_12_FULL_39_24]